MINKKGILIFLSGLCFLPLSFAQAEPNNTDNLGQVLIFISFSMPPTSIQQWAEQAKTLNAPLIVRGLVHDSFPETQQAVAALSQEKSYGVVLDPRLFEKYHITQIPAVVLRRHASTACSPSQSCWQNDSFDVVVGDVGLEAALKTIADHGENTADIASQLLSEWRRHE